MNRYWNPTIKTLDGRSTTLKWHRTANGTTNIRWIVFVPYPSEIVIHQHEWSRER